MFDVVVGGCGGKGTEVVILVPEGTCLPMMSEKAGSLCARWSCIKEKQRGRKRAIMTMEVGRTSDIKLLSDCRSSLVDDS